MIVHGTTNTIGAPVGVTTIKSPGELMDVGNPGYDPVTTVSPAPAVPAAEATPPCLRMANTIDKQNSQGP